jgi:NTE family protein
LIDVALSDRIHALVGDFFGLAENDVAQVTSAFEQVKLDGSSWLFRQGDAGDGLYILVRGRLQVWIESPGLDSRPRFVGEIMPGETVGEISLLTGQTRTASIRAARDSFLIKLDRDNFNRVIEAHPKMAVHMAGNIAERLHDRTSGQKSARRRVRNLCLLPLDDRPELQNLCGDLVAQMKQSDRVLVVDPSRLAQAGLSAQLADDNDIPESLSSWLDEQEDHYDYVLYQCQASADTWTRLALRQADLVIRLADSSTEPGLRELEATLRLDGDADHRLSKQALILWHPGSSREISGTARWLAERKVDYHLHVRDGNAQDIGRLSRTLTGRAVGLVLGAGAARGFAHIGVYKALSEAGLDIDWIGGASIGAIFGAAIAKDWTPEELDQRAYQAFVIGKPFSNYTLPLVSLLSGKRMMRLIRQMLPGNIEDLAVPFYCNSSSLDTGAINVHREGSIALALQASAAMPGALPPAVVDRHLSVDGAVLNGLPVDIMRRFPVSDIIAVDLSSHKVYELDYEELPSAWQLFRSRYLRFGRRYKAPGLIPLLLKSTEIGSMGRVRQQGQDADLLINPDVKRFGLTNVKAFRSIVQVGYECATQTVSDWLKAREQEPT